MIRVIAFDFSGVVIYTPLRSWFEKNNLDRKIYKEITSKWDTGEITLDESFSLLSEKVHII